MKIEILFPEICNLYGDTGNILILEKAFKKENVFKTALIDRPKFLDGDIDMIYMGAMSEKAQVLVLDKLLVHKELMKKLIDNGMKALFTGNAMDLLGKKIIEEDGSEIKGFGFFDFETIIQRSPRLNSLIYGHYKDFEMVGYKTQFSQSFAKDHNNYLFEVEKGIGINKESKLEGFKYKGLIGTNMTGPLLIKNPDFAAEYLDVIVPHHKLLKEAQAKIIEDIKKRL